MMQNKTKENKCLAINEAISRGFLVLFYFENTWELKHVFPDGTVRLERCPVPCCKNVWVLDIGETQIDNWYKYVCAQKKRGQYK